MRESSSVDIDYCAKGSSVQVYKKEKRDNKMLTENVHIAVPTAFFEDESINVQGTIIHIKDLYKQGVKSVLVSGTTGEQHSLNLQEKIEIINGLELEEELISNMEIIFGVASIRQKEAEELAEKIRHSKISGVMLGYPLMLYRLNKKHSFIQRGLSTLVINLQSYIIIRKELDLIYQKKVLFN